MHTKLCIPEEAIAQHVAILGKTGAGKSSALRHIVEYLLLEGKRVCVIDPKGDWWGLKASRDGKGTGFAVIAFGDFKEPQASDVPISDKSGAQVAELVTSGNRPCIIGFRGWMPAAMTRFWVSFASTLFNTNDGELVLVIDEVHNFTPKGQVLNPAVGESIHWTNRLLAEGRGLGVVCLVASQRPQKVHNDTLTSCETLVAMRVIHEADRRALKDWIDGCGDKAAGAQLLANVASLPRGTGFVWSPECGFGPKKVSFPMFQTFDSFAPNKSQKALSPAGWSDVDLTAVREKLAAVIEEAEANDPKALRAEIARLRVVLEAKPAPAAAATEKIIERPVISLETRNVIDHGLTNVANGFGTLVGIFNDILAELRTRPGAGGRSPVQKFTAGGDQVFTAAGVVESVRLPDPEGHTVRGRAELDARSGAGGGSGLGKCERAILRTLDQFRTQGCEIRKLALLSGYRIGGGFRSSLSKLRKIGAMSGTNSGPLFITPAGSALGPFPKMPLGAKLRDYWLNHHSFGKCEREILSALLAKGAMSIGDLATASGYQVGGGFRSALSKLRTAGVIVGRNADRMDVNEELRQ